MQTPLSLVKKAVPSKRSLQPRTKRLIFVWSLSLIVIAAIQTMFVVVVLTNHTELFGPYLGENVFVALCTAILSLEVGALGIVAFIVTMCSLIAIYEKVTERIGDWIDGHS